MFVSRGIPTFAEPLRKFIYMFAQRTEWAQFNCIISATLSHLMMYISYLSENGGIVVSI